jgi:hypothetical protein
MGGGHLSPVTAAGKDTVDVRPYEVVEVLAGEQEHMAMMANFDIV